MANSLGINSEQASFSVQCVFYISNWYVSIHEGTIPHTLTSHLIYMHMKNALLVSLVVLFTGAASAQTMFIPDLNLRTWLNNAKPGIVDASGYCDTVSWNAVPPTAISIYFNSLPDGSTVDLTGIQYLKAGNLGIHDGSQSNINVIWPGPPRVNQNMYLDNIDVGLFTKFLPLSSGLLNLSCDACGLTNVPDFNGVVLTFENIDLSGQTVVIPNSVVSLSLTNCGLTQIPPCPNVSQLTVSNNPLTDWTNLPTGLFSLYADNVGLSYLPTLSATLSILYFPRNGLTALPALPTSLTNLFLMENELTSIGALPPNLTTLYIRKNPLSSLPSMPSSLSSLYADSCLFTTIGPLGSGLTTLKLSDNPLTQLPALPAGMTTLQLKNCAALECLPQLPQSLVTLQLYNSGVACLPNIPPNLNTTGGQDNLGIAPNYCDLTNSACQLLTPYATGIIFNDANTDGIFGTGEAPRSYGIVSAQPGDFMAGSDINGRYVLPLDTGTFTVTGIPSQYEPITTAPHTVTFTGTGEVDSLNHVGYEHVPGIYDLVTEMAGMVVRPGFYSSAWVSVHNAGTEPTDALVQFTFDQDLQYQSSSYTPSSVNGNVIEWNSGTLYPGNTWTANVTFLTPVTVPLGTAIDHTALATPDQADLTPADNIVNFTDTVVGSYDPNDKHVEPRLLSPQQVTDGKRVDYTVRFQNTGTYLAERVLITDTLSEDLQWSSMQLVSSSHENSWYIRHGVLHVLFNNINLPDSTSDELGSHGFVKFSMKPVNSLLLGESVGNVANIYFDFNAPIITNEAVFTVDATATVQGPEDVNMSLWPNPVSDVLHVTTDEGWIKTVRGMTADGREVLSRSVGASQARLNVQALAPGSYVLLVEDSKGSIRHATFIIQRP